MLQATAANLPSCLKPRCAGWPLHRVAFEDLVAAIAACPKGEVVVGRFSPPLHTAYLVDLAHSRLLRCVQSQPMRVQLRRMLARNTSVLLAAAGTAA